MKIKVCIPHYFTQQNQENNYNLPGGWMPSSSKGKTEERTKSFSECLWSLVHVSKKNNYAVIDIPTGRAHPVFPILQQFDISITIITDGKNVCEEVLNKYQKFISVREINLDDSRNLVFEAREYLLNQNDYDLYYYCEDDIKIVTSKFFQKIKWFAEKTNHTSVLMPHRFENINSPEIEKIYIDGPIDQNFLKKFMIPKENALQLTYEGQEIIFDKPMNPHSATFCLTKIQRDLILKRGLKRRSNFISSFESVATLTPMEFFQIYKTNWKFNNFLEVEQCSSNYEYNYGL